MEIGKNYEHRSLTDVMEKSYLDYSMSVIESRALPDVRDGLKPVQRRTLYAMLELHNTPDKPHRKCARIVGDTMGKYHPHGDSSIYEALVNMAQNFKMRHPLVDGHGNFGSMDGDGAAAMRYTEARFSKEALLMVQDMDENTVDFVPNFDDTEKEPVVLPARFPNLLVNGANGIAVGMATNIPPHNMAETINACICMLENEMKGKETSVDDLLEHIKGPDFPTGGVILGENYKKVYHTGIGKIKMEAVYHFEKEGKKDRIVFTELPYRVNKADLVKKIADRAKEQKLDISDVRDETSREGLRVVVELKRNAMPELILNDLKKHTDIRCDFNANMLCIVNGEPKCLNLRDMIGYYLKHQEEVVSRRTKYELDKAEKRAHIIKGLLIAIDNIDAIIKIIRGSADVETAKKAIMEQFSLTDIQAQYIVDMRLRSLAGLEQQKLKEELDELEKKIDFYKKVLGDRKELLKIIRKELRQIRDKYSNPRRTSHAGDAGEITDLDLIKEEPVVIMRTHMGYIKRIKPELFHTQKRGGKGAKGISTIEDDYVEDVMTTTTHADIMFFTSKGRVYSLKAYRIPESGKNARGTALVSLLKLSAEERITGIVSETGRNEDEFLLLTTAHGKTKRICMNALPETIRSTGMNIMKLKEDDTVCSAIRVTEEDNVMMVTRNGFCLCFPVSDIRAMGKSAAGVNSMNLSEEDEVISVQKQIKDHEIVIVTENGYAKRLACNAFRTLKSRSGKGVRILNTSAADKIGNVVSVLPIESLENDLLVVTNKGQTIRIPVKQIQLYSRYASGTRTINIGNDSVVIDIIQLEKITDVHEDAAL